MGDVAKSKKQKGLTQSALRGAAVHLDRGRTMYLGGACISAMQGQPIGGDTAGAWFPDVPEERDGRVAR